MNLKPIPEFHGTYAIAEDGVIYRLTGNTGKPLLNPKPIKQHLRKDGYCLSHLSKMNTVKTFLSHRLIWEVLRGPVPEGLEINHVNGVRSDNRLDNLEICSRSANMTHKYRVLGYRQHSCAMPGERNGNALLTADIVREIRDRCSKGESQTEVAGSLGIHQTTVSDVFRRKSWRHVD